MALLGKLSTKGQGDGQGQSQGQGQGQGQRQGEELERVTGKDAGIREMTGTFARGGRERDRFDTQTGTGTEV